MDYTDRKLLMLLSRDVRMRSGELAVRLGVSRQAAQKRLKMLRSKGVFERMSVSVSWSHLGATGVLIFGRSRAESSDEVLDGLGESELTIHAISAGASHFYVTGLLRNIAELDEYAEFVSRVAEMPDPTVGVFAMHSGIMPDEVDGPRRISNDGELTALDFRIIESLKGDARRPVHEIAEAVGTSPKTVSRRLERMTSHGCLECNVPWEVIPGAQMFTLVQVRLREGADRITVGRRLYSKYENETLWVRSFSNLPGFLLCTISADTMKDACAVLKDVREDRDVLAAIPNLLYEERTYMNWRDRLTAV